MYTSGILVSLGYIDISTVVFRFYIIIFFKRTFKIIVEDSSIELDERYINVSIGISSDFKNESLLSMYVTVLKDIDNLMVTAIRVN